MTGTNRRRRHACVDRSKITFIWDQCSRRRTGHMRIASGSFALMPQPSSPKRPLHVLATTHVKRYIQKPRLQRWDPLIESQVLKVVLWDYLAGIDTSWELMRCMQNEHPRLIAVSDTPVLTTSLQRMFWSESTEVLPGRSYESCTG